MHFFCKILSLYGLLSAVDLLFICCGFAVQHSIYYTFVADFSDLLLYSLLHNKSNKNVSGDLPISTHADLRPHAAIFHERCICSVTITVSLPMQNLTPLALSLPEKSTTVQTNTHTKTNKQTLADISTPCLSALVDNKYISGDRSISTHADPTSLDILQRCAWDCVALAIRYGRSTCPLFLSLKISCLRQCVKVLNCSLSNRCDLIWLAIT